MVSCHQTFDRLYKFFFTELRFQDNWRIFVNLRIFLTKIVTEIFWKIYSCDAHVQLHFDFVMWLVDMFVLLQHPKLFPLGLPRHCMRFNKFSIHEQHKYKKSWQVYNEDLIVYDVSREFARIFSSRQVTWRYYTYIF